MDLVSYVGLRCSKLNFGRAFHTLDFTYQGLVARFDFHAGLILKDYTNG